ncbi:MAG: hypothetical protein IT326_00520 [Anaerolineae bacterium]|nr:hypothetical protein [Anaerolineae bacterium]
MFAYITLQVAGYYAIAGIGLLLAWGHLHLSRWVRPLMDGLIGLWLVVGLPLTLLALLMLFESKEPPAAVQIALMALLPLAYPVAPLVLRRFYRGQAVAQVLEEADPCPHWLELMPAGVRILCGLLLMLAAGLHLPMLLRGPFPWFGRLLTGEDGLLALGALVLTALGLVVGLARLNQAAWRAALALCAVLGLSTALTLQRLAFADLLAVAQLPEYEKEFFSGLPFLGWHPTLLFLAPLLVLLAALLASARHFIRPDKGKTQPTGTT